MWVNRESWEVLSEVSFVYGRWYAGGSMSALLTRDSLLLWTEWTALMRLELGHGK